MGMIKPHLHAQGKMKLTKGYIREDGMVFWSYTSRYKSGERWVTKDQFDKYQDYYKNYNKKRHEENRDEAIERTRNWVKANRERNNKSRRDARNKNIILFREKCAEYRNKSRHLRIANQAKRRVSKKTTSILLTESQKKIIKCFYEQAQRLKNKLGINFHVDHIVPISKGGLHAPTNLQVLPEKINLSKNCHRVFKWSELNEA